MWMNAYLFFGTIFFALSGWRLLLNLREAKKLKIHMNKNIMNKILIAILILSFISIVIGGILK